MFKTSLVYQPFITDKVMVFIDIRYYRYDIRQKLDFGVTKIRLWVNF